MHRSLLRLPALRSARGVAQPWSSASARFRNNFVHSPGDAAPQLCTLVPGDGIGQEICQVVVDVFKSAGVPVEWEIVNTTGKGCLPAVIASLKKNRVGLKGVFHTEILKGEESINLALRQELDLYAHVLHAFNMPGVPARHSGIDIAVIRQNTEGEYSGHEHEVVPGVVESLKRCSRFESLRIAQYAFEYAYLNGRKKVSVVHKANIQKEADGLFLECAREVAAKFPTIEHEEVIVDNAMQMVQNPNQFDVLLLPNLYGNILGNIASGLTGGPGLTAGANVGPGVSLFEPGARHVGLDIAGLHVANPAAMLFSSVSMLRHVRLPSFADKIQSAVTETLATSPNHTQDLGGSADTLAFKKAVIERL